MVEFILEVYVCKEDDPDERYERLYKKMLWPVLPRTGEWFQISETETCSLNKIDSVQHWLSEDNNPQIHVEIPLKDSDYKRLQKSTSWKNELSDL